jgi:hypothetical protein
MKAKSTTFRDELEDLIARLAKAGVSPEEIGLELMSHGAAFLHQKFGAEHVVKQCQAIAAAMQPTTPAGAGH